MPNTELLATAEGTQTSWTLGAGASKWVAVNKPDDDVTSYITEATDNHEQSFTYSNLPSQAVEIQSVNIDSSGKRAGGSTNSTYQTYWYLGAAYTYSSAHQPGAVWADYVDDDMAKPGGGNWSASDVNNAEFGCHHNLSGGTGMNVTTLQGNIDWLTPSGGFMWLLESWLPPLLPFIGGSIDVIKDLSSYFAQFRTKPSNEEDFARIREWLQCRRVTLGPSLHPALV
jgi:hypothetical protein